MMSHFEGSDVPALLKRIEQLFKENEKLQGYLTRANEELAIATKEIQDFNIVVKQLQERVNELENIKTIAIHSARADNITIEQLKDQCDEYKSQLRDIRQAALPDPHDERDISVEWLRAIINRNTPPDALEQMDEPHLADSIDFVPPPEEEI